MVRAFTTPLSFRVVKLATFLTIAGALVLVSGSDGRFAHAAFSDTDGDGAIDPAEEISGSDPNDSASSPENDAVEFLGGRRVCADSIDNDLDGLIDNEDLGCRSTDVDLVPDDIEVRLGSNPSAAFSVPEDARLDATIAFYLGLSVQYCGDGIDNDSDGRADGQDTGCQLLRSDGDAFNDVTEKTYGSDPENSSSVPEHRTPNPVSCTDGFDNDGDGDKDASDVGCGPPPNDARANAQGISVLPFNSEPVHMENSTAESDEPIPDCLTGVRHTVWYRYVAPEDQVVIADTFDSTFNGVFAVWSVSETELSEVECFQLGWQAAVTVRANQTLLFQFAGSFPDPLSSVTFSLVEGTPPPNDDFANAEIVDSLPFSSAPNSASATTELDEPDDGCGSGPASVWYRFTPKEDTLIIADTAGSDYPTVIGVWSDRPAGLESITCAVGWFVQSESGMTTARPARLSFAATAGGTYYIRVRAALQVSRVRHHLVFNMSVGVPPPNDDFPNATTITALPFTSTVDTITADLEPQEPEPRCYGSPRRTAWYRYTPMKSGYLLANVSTSFDAGRTDAIVAVYQGTSFDSLTLLDCAEANSLNGDSALEVEAGQTYHFQAGTIGESPSISLSTDVTLRLEELTIPACPLSRFTVQDRAGDAQTGFESASGSAGPDVRSVAAGADAQHFCVRVELSKPVVSSPPSSDEATRAIVAFDLNDDTVNGASLRDCVSGIDMTLGFDLEALFVPLWNAEPGSSYAFASVEGRTLSLVVPLGALGGDGRFRFAVIAESGDAYDCAPNGGAINFPTPTALGDPNCDGGINAIDSQLILQRVANLLSFAIACEYAGDVNGTGSTDTLDALLILQYSSGMLSRF